MKFIIILMASLYFSHPSFAASCITPTSSTAEKASLGTEAQKIMGGAASWTEVKKDTNILETKNTITMKVNYTDPFKSQFAAGSMRAHLTKICVKKGSLSIGTNRGTVTLVKSGKHLAAKTMVGTYYILPSNQVVQQTAELQRSPVHSADTGVLL